MLWKVFRSKAVCDASAQAAAALEDATHVQSRAGLDCVSVRPVGSVVIPGSASFSSPKTARTQA